MKKITLEKKDYRYILLFLVFIIVGIFVFYYGTETGKDEIVSYIGFAGTLISIILAVAALIYTYYQNYVYGSTAQKLDESATKIVVATNELQRVSQLADNVESSMKEVGATLQELSSSMPDKIDKLQNALGTYNENVFSLHEKTKNDLLSFVGTQTQESSMDVVEKDLEVVKIEQEEINIVVNFLTDFQFMYLYYVKMMKDKKMKGDMNQFSYWALESNLTVWSEIWKNEKNKINISSVLEMTVGQCVSVMQMFTFKNYISTDGYIQDFETLAVSDPVRNAITLRIEKQQEPLVELISSLVGFESVK